MKPRKFLNKLIYIPKGYRRLRVGERPRGKNKMLLKGVFIPLNYSGSSDYPVELYEFIITKKLKII